MSGSEQRLTAALGFDSPFLDGLTGFHRDDTGELIGITQQAFTNLEQQPGALGVRHRSHGARAFLRRGDRPA